MTKTFLVILIIGTFVTSCSKGLISEEQKLEINGQEVIEIPNEKTKKSDLFYNKKTSLWSMNDRIYSGYAVSYYDTGQIKEKFGIVNGRKQNEAILWYPDGHYKIIAHYNKGKLHGEKKSWSSDENHRLISQLQYRSGRAHGTQKKWYTSGEIFKILQLDMGKEVGIQKAFRKNGDLFANYEARDGRTFGLKKASLCFGLEDEEVQFKIN